MRPFYRKDLFRDEIIKVNPKELIVKIDQEHKKLSLLRMEKGQSITLNTEDYEVGIVFLSGTATVRTESFEAVDKGGRKDVFSGQPTAIYMPRDTEYTILATGYGILEIALCMVKTEIKGEPFIVESEDITSSEKGVFNWKRVVHEIFVPEKTKKAGGLIIGESFGCPGPWATYPYEEKSDGNLEETIFLLKVSPNPFEKVQIMRSADLSRAYYVHNDTAIVVSEPYKPIAKLEDAKVYNLWFKVAK